MFCEKCGNSIPDNQMFCSYCGAPVKLTPTSSTGGQSEDATQWGGQVNQQYQQMGAQGQQYQQMGMQGQQYQQMGMQGQQYQQMGMQGQQYQQMGMQGQQYQHSPNVKQKKEKTAEQRAKKKKRLIIAGILSILVVLAGAAVLLLLLLRTPTVNLNDYITIECDGYNSIGKAQAVFDEEQFYDDFEDKLKFKSGKAEQNSEYTSAAEHLLEKYIKGSLDKSENLSNGDKIKYVWDIDTEGVEADLKVELDFDDIDYTVEGLEEAETFDLFSNIEVRFEGSAPNGYVVIENNNDMYPVNYWNFVADKPDGLSNGDKVVISLEGEEDQIDECLAENGKIPDVLSKEFEVSGLSTFVSSKDQISADALSTMQNKAKQNAENDIPYEAENPKYDYVGYYLLAEKAGGGAPDRNHVVMVYAVSTDLDIVVDEANYVGKYGYYAVTTFYDLSLDDSGNCVVDASNSEDTYNELTMNTHARDKWNSEYKVTYWGYESLTDVKRDNVDNYLSQYDLIEVMDSSVKPVASTGNISTNVDGGMVAPDSDTDYLTEDQVKNMSQDEIQDAINEIYARHGYIFQTESLQRYYEQFSWYTPYSGDQEKVKNLFNSVETANIMLLEKYRD